ncbi:bifunctional glutamate N-acetyltransferase/amino-acid acetyltransferase ArgJ [Methylacidiphilum caldifontis]|uniref:bifunctional glutamate N-acetyltransferase/amino-acid acetyltransferase ArgJ n=1 Tax=Methylacidiphilum caldifontis TaxID=2795386 RepID=UPI001A902073|nr:bifunctional glutamate N-acetyltransferase/amino-acid acetyltransferase ArgJ [Methylacidiphilum caldifontis]QSR87950.1 bifunctional glutamate N-acetyltransferase/amino-acid acetyltransferase ArgJ [Methylacidiphilum caldifontis]
MKEESIEFIKSGGVTAPRGFLAAGVSCGIKPGKKGDLALVVSQQLADVAGVFTQNRIKAAPVLVSMKRVKKGKARAVVINSGNANACTGSRGLEDAEQMAAVTASFLGCSSEEVCVCSTGRIGVFLPMKKIVKGIEKAFKQLNVEGSKNAAEAIMTTDTVPKQAALKVKIEDKEIFIGGMAKGSGMICPNLATTLGIITTDAVLSPEYLDWVLRCCVQETFNRISVDGETSTNDTILLFSNGMAKNTMISSENPHKGIFKNALRLVLDRLSRAVLEDGEGVTKVVEILVQGAVSDKEAEQVARAVGNSLLVKCSWNGEDPNWGRILCAIGYSGADVDQNKVDVFYSGIQIVSSGVKTDIKEGQIKKILKMPMFSILIDLHKGEGQYRFLSTDLSERYVRINSNKE